MKTGEQNAKRKRKKEKKNSERRKQVIRREWSQQKWRGSSREESEGRNTHYRQFWFKSRTVRHGMVNVAKIDLRIIIITLTTIKTKII